MRCLLFVGNLGTTMIDEIEFEGLCDELTLRGIAELFNRNRNNLTYFYHDSDMVPASVVTLKTFEKGELIIPYRTNENGTFIVIYTNKRLAYSLIENNYKVGAVKLKNVLGLAGSLMPVKGIFFQANSCWFTVDLQELSAELQKIS